jgi:hypothetical protein
MCSVYVYYVAPPPSAIRAAPGARATCTAVLFGVFEAHPPLGTTPGVPGTGEGEGAGGGGGS